MTTNENEIGQANGHITQVLGAVIDVEFPAGKLPSIYTALKTSNSSINDKQWNLTLEVAQHLGDNTVRTIAMDSTDGLRRGLAVLNTCEEMKMPVGEATLGRVLNLLGEPIDEAGPVETKGLSSDSSFSTIVLSTRRQHQCFGYRYKGHRSFSSLSKRRKGWVVWWCRCRKNRSDPRIDP